MDMNQLAEALPKEAITKITDLACTTFQKVTYPLTATTAGIGLLIETKFEALNEMQKVLAAKAIEKAKEKVEQASTATSESIKPQIYYIALECADTFVDEVQEEIWTNVLARETVLGEIHPEIARLLSKLTTADLMLLNDIAMNQEKNSFSRILATFKKDKSALTPVRKSFNHFFLSELGLITHQENQWMTTYAGVELLCSIEPLSP
ncbi:hypothetical protein [Pseudoalteromonas umbrosa]|uniref:hypothetical protein n=1 Tax=Pseudoalteromonas umbrosa TaxID=3048489 RepID=UPI0024C3217A|nr:hypothetical protein [Pseudoalteromonas sp. B95]MDK1286840.1 hypothetical protein [Pseudoalteromonas sp. B95]